MANSIQKMEERLATRMTALEKVVTNSAPAVQQSTATSSHATGPVINPTRKTQTPAQKKTISNPLNAHHPSRLIVQVLPEGIKPDERPEHTKLVNTINERLATSQESKHLVVVSVKWNGNGNCIVFTRSDQTAAELKQHANRFVDLIAQGHQYIIREDKKWVKVRVDGVRTGRLDPVPGLYSSETLDQELRTMNPLYATLKLTEGPQWLRPEKEIVGQNHSSITFAAEEGEGIEHLQSQVGSRIWPKPQDFTVTLRSDIAQDLDIQVVDVAQPGAPTTTFVNVYNDNKQRIPAVERVKTLQLPQDTPVVPLGDWNLHHETWSRPGVNGNRRSNSFVEWTTEKGYTFLNKKGEVTFIPHATEGSPSVIDLTLVNAAAVNQDTVKDWTVDDTMLYGSDHKGIWWVVDQPRVGCSKQTDSNTV
ncbi:Endonuclease/exonuclease/phosphatase [Mycena crocata]|nr:Endonuclease/exonuclease/phosphatase [Mycena crocata]